MTLTDKFHRHAKLVERMASRVGVDLDEALQRSELPAAEFLEGVYTCIGCENVEACEHWLEAPGEGADAAPGYCRNAKLFKSLSK